MARRKNAQDIAPKVRAYIKQAFEKLEKKGKPLSEIIARELDENFAPTMNALKGYVPFEIEVDHEHTHIHELTDDQLADIAATGSARIIEQAGGKKKPAGVH